MSAATIKDLSKLCIHTITTKPWILEKTVETHLEKDIAFKEYPFHGSGLMEMSLESPARFCIG